MLNKMRSINAFLASHMFYIAITAIILGYFFPFNEPNPYAKVVNISLFAMITFFASISLSLSDFWQVLKQPRIPIWLLFTIHVVGPFIVYILASIFYPDSPDTRMGMLIASTLPMGVSTVVWLSVLGGNIAVSLVTITLDTLLAPFIIAIFLNLMFSTIVDINYTQMLVELLLMVSVPSLIGMSMHNILVKRPKLYTTLSISGALFSKFCMLAVIYISVATVVPSIEFNAGIIKMTLVIYLLVLTSFALGYLASLPVKNVDRSMFLSILYNVGMRNINFGVVLAVSYFPPSVAIPITLMMLFQQPTAAIVGHFVNKIYHIRADL